jgi:hypothetical protein
MGDFLQLFLINQDIARSQYRTLFIVGFGTAVPCVMVVVTAADVAIQPS